MSTRSRRPSTCASTSQTARRFRSQSKHACCNCPTENYRRRGRDHQVTGIQEPGAKPAGSTQAPCRVTLWRDPQASPTHQDQTEPSRPGKTPRRKDPARCAEAISPQQARRLSVGARGPWPLQRVAVSFRVSTTCSRPAELLPCYLVTNP